MRGPTGGGFFGGGASRGTAPAIMIQGQSNAGVQDHTTTGWVPDPRCLLTWYDGVSLNGPAVIATQTAGGHSIELTLATGLAAYYGSNILVGKTWGDGTLSQDWVRSIFANMWSRTATQLESFLKQMVAVGVTQLAYYLLQGESESLLINAAYTSQWGLNTGTYLDSISTIAKAFGIRVKFFVVLTNSNLTGVAGIDASQLASVRAQQVALVAGRTDATLVSFDSIVPALGLHYGAGQTLTMGTTEVARIAAAYPSAQPPALTPPTILGIYGANLLVDLDSRAGIGVAPGSPVGLWTDQSGQGKSPAAAGAARPTFVAGVVNGVPGVQADGVDDVLNFAGLALPAPGTQNRFTFGVLRQDTYTVNDRIFGSVGGPDGLIQSPGTPLIASYNGALTGGNPGAPIGQPAAFEYGLRNDATLYSANSAGVITTGDYTQMRSASAISGALFGNDAIADLGLFNGNGGNFANITLVKFCIAKVFPNQLQRDQWCGYKLANYGIGVGYC